MLVEWTGGSVGEKGWGEGGLLSSSIDIRNMSDCNILLFVISFSSSMFGFCISMSAWDSSSSLVSSRREDWRDRVDLILLLSLEVDLPSLLTALLAIFGVLPSRLMES